MVGKPWFPMCPCRHRQGEIPYYSHFSFIAETWNILSNLSFIIGSVYCHMLINDILKEHEIYPESVIRTPIPFGAIQSLVLLQFIIGVCSGIHHALCDRYAHITIFIDWAPIAMTIVILLSQDVLLLWHLMSYPALFTMLLAFCFLADDHITQYCKKSHMYWHLLMGLGVAMWFVDIIRETKVSQPSFLL